MSASKSVSKGPVSAVSVEREQVALVEVLPKRAALEVQHQRLRDLESELLERSLSIVDAAMRFAEIDPSDEEPPAAWVDELGHVGAMIRFRVARAGWMGAKDAPIAIKCAATVGIGIIKSRATERAGPKQLNVAIAYLSAPLPQFPEQDIEPE